MQTKSGKLFLFFSILIILIIAGGIFLHFDQEKQIPLEPLVFAHDKGVLPNFQVSFEKQGIKAKEMTGYGFTPVPSQTSDLFINQMRTSLPTTDAPDLFTWWSTYKVKELVDNDLVDDLTDLWDKYDDVYDPGIRNAYTLNGKVYGFPYNIEYWAVWYNKKIFKRLGIKEPETFEDFLLACEIIKANDISPILSSFQQAWYTFVWFEEMIIGYDPDLYIDLCEGKVSYTDPRVKKAMTVWAKMINNGYFTEPTTNMFSNVAHLWDNEKFAMVLCGSWYYSSALVAQGVDPDTIGVFILPSHNPAAGNNIIMETGPVLTAKHSQNSTGAKKIADWWMSSEGNEYFSKLFGSYSANKTSDSKHLPRVKQKLLKDITKGNYAILNRYWEATPTPIGEKAVEKLGKFIVNPDTMDEVLFDIQKASTDYWQSKGK